MKKIVLFVSVLLISLTTFAQDYSRWAIGAKLGAHSVSDESAIVTDPYNHYGFDVRYNVNEIVGVGVDFGHDNLSLESIDGITSNVDFTRLHAKATLSVFELLRLPHKNMNVLFNGGPGFSRLNHTDSDDTQDVFSISGGMEVIFRVGKYFNVNAGYTSTAQVAQDKTIDNIYKLNNSGISSVVDNLTVGVTFYPRSKKTNELVHADWYSPEPVIPVINNITEVTEVREITKEVQVPVPAECNCKFQEFVFFAHDKYDIRKEALNAITKTYTYLSENEDAKLKIYGFASPTASSAEYNKALSEKRGNEVKSKLVQMGIASNRIEVVPEGKDFKYEAEHMHDVARRVELIVE